MTSRILRVLALFFGFGLPFRASADSSPGACQLGAMYDNSLCRGGAAPVPVDSFGGRFPPKGQTISSSSPGWDKKVGLDAQKVNSPAPQEPAEPDSGGGFFGGLGKFFGGIFNAVKNLGKLIITAPVAIVSNVVEGVVGGVRSAAEGDVLGAVTAPAKIAVNAAWNTVNTGAAAMNVLSDPVWSLVKPRNDPEIDIERVDFDGAQRVLVKGGPLSHAASATAFVTAGAYIVTPRSQLSEDTLNHEYAHTLQFQRSFVLDFLGRYVADPKPFEDEADLYARSKDSKGSEGLASAAGRLSPGTPSIGTPAPEVSETGFIARDKRSGERYPLLASAEGTLHIRKNGLLIPVLGFKRSDLAGLRPGT